MSSFPQTLGTQNQKQAQALIKALSASGLHLRWKSAYDKSPLEINSVLNSFAYSVAGQCYDETQIQRYVQLVGKMGFEKTKLAAETPIGSVYCMPIDAVAYRRRNPTSTEHLTVFTSEGVMPDGKFMVNTITHNPRQSKNCLLVKPVDYTGVNSISYIPCDRGYQYFLSIDELYGRMNRQGKYASLSSKEQAIKVEPFRQVKLNQLLQKLNISGATYAPVCVMDGGISYGIKREVATSTLLPESLKYQGFLGLRYDFMSIRERTQAREALEALYQQSGTPAKFVEAYKHYADLPLSYARYNLGIDKSPENFERCINELCIRTRVSSITKEYLKDTIIPNLPSNADLPSLATYAGSNIPGVLSFL